MHTSLVTTLEEEDILGHFKAAKLEARVLIALAHKA